MAVAAAANWAEMGEDPASASRKVQEALNSLEVGSAVDLAAGSTVKLFLNM